MIPSSALPEDGAPPEPHEWTDAELLAFRGMALQVAGSVLWEAEDVQDVAQSTVTALYALRHVPAGGASGWVRRRARDRAIDLVRRKNRGRIALQRLAIFGVDPRGLESSDDLLVARMAFDELVGHLSRRQRHVFTLRFIDELSRREIAERLGIGEDAVKTHLRLGLQRLREFQRRPMPPRGRAT